MSNSETFPPQVQPRKWRWWHFALAALGLILLLSMFGGSSSPKLKVSIFREGGFKGVRVVNTGDKAITITGLVVNDRKDCRVIDLDQLMIENPPFKTAKLDIGESGGWFTQCQIVRVSISTSAGNATYEFK